MDILKFTSTIFDSLYSSRIVIALIVITLTLLWSWWKRPHPKFPPGPRGIPLLGVAPFLGKFPETVFKKWSLEKFGPIMSVRISSEDIVVLNTYEAINKAFVDLGSFTSGRPRIHLFNQVSNDAGVFIKSYNDQFKTLKQFSLNAMKELGMGKREMEKIVEEEMQYFIEFLKTKIGKPANLTLDYYNLIANIVSKFVLGRRFEYDDPMFKGVFKHIHELFSDQNDSDKIIVLNFFELLRYLPPFYGVNNRFAHRNKMIIEGLQVLIEEHKKTFDKNHKRDFIDFYLAEQKKEKIGLTKTDNFFTNEDLDLCVRDLFMAGTETSSTSLSWLFLLVLHYPKHYARIMEEIDSALGTHLPPSMESRNEMPFTSAFMQEFFRFRTLVPLGLQHCTTSTIELEGYVIPKGTKVVSNLWGAHNDSTTWPNPEKFDPYRHINKDGKFVFSNKIIPFGTGPRLCLGESLARMEIFIAFVTILQKFTIAPAGDKPLPLDSAVDQFVFHPTKYEIIINER